MMRTGKARASPLIETPTTSSSGRSQAAASAALTYDGNSSGGITSTPTPPQRTSRASIVRAQRSLRKSANAGSIDPNSCCLNSR